MHAPLGLRGTGVACERNERWLFKDIDFSLEPGQALQVTGPNGCGKTTLLRMICGLLPLHYGQLYWDTQLIEKAHSEFYKHLYYLGHKKAIKLALSPLENLQLSLMSVEHRHILMALATVGLADYAATPCWQLSAGQQQRVALAALSLSKTKLWILDEPFTALDQQGIAHFEACFEQHVQQGGMLMLTTHHSFTLPTVRVHSLSLAV